jgi:L-fucose isomerase-like protein
MMEVKKTTFALFFGNRGFFPGSLMGAAREELQKVLTGLGHEVIMMDAAATRHGAVETTREGELYADFLAKNKGKYGGVILCLPNFGDETGAIAALKDCGVPILIQAYPDEMDKMAPATRRDSFCGKFSIMDVFFQYGLKFTILPPHTCAPSSPRFAEQVDYFDRMCRVYNGMKKMTVGAVGARTTAFKTVRIDEMALQRHGITMETLDLSEIFFRMNKLRASTNKYKEKADRLRGYTNWTNVAEGTFDKLVRVGVVLDEVVEEYQMDALAVRCWQEMQRQLGISPCVLLSEMNDRGLPTACEVDMGNAVTMFGLRLASGEVTTCLDWNNNYGDEENKCILFHCGPVPQSMMTEKGQIVDHAILANAVGEGCAVGCNVGRIKPTDITFGSMLTEGGKLKFYLGEGAFTGDPIPADFFGCAGVVEIANLQDALMKIGYAGHRHHTSVTPGHVAAPTKEAFEKYLGYDVLSV